MKRKSSNQIIVGYHFDVFKRKRKIEPRFPKLVRCVTNDVSNNDVHLRDTELSNISLKNIVDTSETMNDDVQDKSILEEKTFQVAGCPSPTYETEPIDNFYKNAPEAIRPLFKPTLYRVGSESESESESKRMIEEPSPLGNQQELVVLHVDYSQFPNNPSICQGLTNTSSDLKSDSSHEIISIASILSNELRNEPLD